MKAQRLELKPQPRLSIPKDIYIYIEHYTECSEKT